MRKGAVFHKQPCGTYFEKMWRLIRIEKRAGDPSINMFCLISNINRIDRPLKKLLTHSTNVYSFCPKIGKIGHLDRSECITPKTNYLLQVNWIYYPFHCFLPLINRVVQTRHVLLKIISKRPENNEKFC